VRYVVKESIIWVVGQMWMPGITGATVINLTDGDVDHARDDDGRITRDSVGMWLDSHAGDFAEVLDFQASIEDGTETVEISWANKDSEEIYSDCMEGEF